MSAPMTKKKAALYLRLSVDKGAAEGKEESDSITRQRADLLRLAEAEGYNVEERHVFVDDGASGGKHRDAALLAVEALASGEVAALLSWKIDRFSRMGAFGDDANRLHKALQRPGALFIAYKDSLRSDMPAWSIVAPVLFGLAAAERENTSARVTAARETNIREGRYVGGPVPTGYRVAGRKGAYRLEPDDHAAAVLTEAARRLVNGESVGSVARYLDAEGIVPARAARWTVASVRSTLTSPHMLGRVTFRGDVLRDERGLPREVFPPVLPAGLHASVVRTFEERANTRPNYAARERKESRLLAGIAVCASCGARLYQRIGSRPGMVIYACKSKHSGTHICPAPVSISAIGLEALVEEKFLAVAGAAPILRPYVIADDSVALWEARAALEATKEALASAVDDDDDDEVDRLRERRRTLRDDVERLEAEGSGARVAYEPTGETLADLWKREDVAGRRDLLARAGVVVEVSKGSPGRRTVSTGRVEVFFGGGVREDGFGGLTFGDYLVGQTED